MTGWAIFSRRCAPKWWRDRRQAEAGGRGPAADSFKTGVRCWRGPADLESLRAGWAVRGADVLGAMLEHDPGAVAFWTGPTGSAQDFHRADMPGGQVHDLARVRHRSRPRCRAARRQAPVGSCCTGSGSAPAGAARSRSRRRDPREDGRPGGIPGAAASRPAISRPSGRSTREGVRGDRDDAPSRSARASPRIVPPGSQGMPSSRLDNGRLRRRPGECVGRRGRVRPRPDRGFLLKLA